MVGDQVGIDVDRAEIIDPYETKPEVLRDIPIWGTVFEGRPAPL